MLTPTKRHYAILLCFPSLPQLPVPSPLTIFRSSYSLVNSRLRISSSWTRDLEDSTRASFGVITPSVWMRSSILAKRGWGTVVMSAMMAQICGVGPTFIAGERNLWILQQLGTQHVGEGVVLFKKGKDRAVGSSYVCLSVH
jgi:hypothetical protein